MTRSQSFYSRWVYDSKLLTNKTCTIHLVAFRGGQKPASLLDTWPVFILSYWYTITNPFYYWLICFLTQPGEDKHSTWQTLSHPRLPGRSIVLDHHQAIGQLPPECRVITLYESQIWNLGLWGRILIFYSSIGSACFEVTRWTSFFTMCYFLAVSYWLVQCNTVVLPGNVKLHAFLKGVHPAGVSLIYSKSRKMKGSQVVQHQMVL